MSNRSATATATEPAASAQVFRALADPTRLRIIEQLGAGPAPTSHLADSSGMSLPSFLQHLRVLEENGLVTSRKEGRSRVYRLTPAPLHEAETWLAERRRAWERRLDRLDEHLKEMKTEQP
jgi:DNA-binding transcriptional ArsR family regulator